MNAYIHPRSPRSLLVSLALVAAACGGKTTVDSGNGTDGGTDGSNDAPAPSPCPASVPDAGGACDRNGLVCGYGDDPRWDCRTIATCNGTWSVAADACPPLPPATCPATLSDASGKDCATKDTFCSYDGLACQCTNCVEYPIEHCSGPLTWRCDAPNTDPGCPAAIPNVGIGCASEGKQCTYGCENGHSRTCSDGVWVASNSPYGCPVSSKQYKRDIHYLAFDDLRRVADQVRSLRLATWKYLDPKIASGTRLGIIVEDAPASDAVDPRGDRVDLYGYTSMAVAAAQVNARDVDDLRREVEALRAEIAELRYSLPSCPKAKATKPLPNP